MGRNTKLIDYDKYLRDRDYDKLIDNREIINAIEENEKYMNDYASDISNDTLDDISSQTIKADEILNEIDIDDCTNVIEVIPLEELIDVDSEEFNLANGTEKKDNNTFENALKVTKSVAYIIFKLLMEIYNFKCWEGQIFVYNRKEGRFIHLSENRLKVLIRTGWDEKILERLSRNVVLEIIDKLTSEPSIQIDEGYFNCYTHMMNFLNGVLDLETNDFMEHSPEYKFTHCIQANYNFNPKGGHIFKRFIKTSMENDINKEHHLQEVVGYMLSEFYTAKKAPMLIGKPHSGKSTLNRIISTLIGSDHVANVPLHRLHEKFILAHLSTKKVNICSEISDEALSSIEVFKNITGNDELVAEYKGKDHFTYKSKIKLLFAGNSMPILKNRDVTSAFFDRLTFINFNYTVPEDRRDYKLEEKLLNQEKEFIVAWAVEGIKRLMDNNFVFSESEEAITYKKRYIIEQNNITEFMNSYCNLKPGAKVHLKDMYFKYLKYCHENCFKACSKDDLFLEVSKYNVKKKRFRIDGSKPLWGYEGINLKSESEYYRYCETMERLEQEA